MKAILFAQNDTYQTADKEIAKHRKRGFTRCAVDQKRKLEYNTVDVHTTTYTNRARDGADDIHREEYAAGHHNKDKIPQCHHTKPKNTIIYETLWHSEHDFNFY
jgi:hypothetical protein